MDLEVLAEIERRHDLFKRRIQPIILQNIHFSNACLKKT